MFKIITRIKLLFSNYLGRYSYSFRARQELISLQLQFCGSDGIFLYSYSSVQLHQEMVRGIIFRKLQLQLHKKGFQIKNVMISERMVNTFSGDCPGGGGLSTGWPGVKKTRGQGSNIYVLCAEPKEHKHLRPGARPGGCWYPAGRIGDRGDREIVYVRNVYVPFPAPNGHVPSAPSYVPSYVPSVPRKFCPLNWNLHINRPTCPGCPWDVPNLALGRFRGIPTTKFFYVIYLYCVFSPFRKCPSTVSCTALSCESVSFR